MTPIERQPLAAPLACGGGIVAGISAALIGVFTMVDCFSFRTKRGECNEIVQVSVPAVVAGLAAVSGAWGGLWTINPRLRTGTRRRDDRGRFVPEGED